ncbi:hypothetical protein FRC03_009012 [Tulasnella sp. 419]|nr:hypothetical protein FRC03_009012 [Tulasnella sp. 419]
MAPKIYKSNAPDIALPETSIFTFLFSEEKGWAYSKYPTNRAAYIDAVTGKTLTRAETKDLSLTLAWGLNEKLGKKRGDVIMVFSPNSLSYPILIYGAVAAGLKITFANAAYTPPELAHQLKDSGAYEIFVHPALIPVAVETLKLVGVKSESEIKKRIVVMGLGGEPEVEKLGGEWLKMEDLLKGGKRDTEERFDGKDSRETVYMCYSSGTTGLSKGVETMHYNATSVMSMAKLGLAEALPEDRENVMLGILPFFHVYGLVVLVQFSFWSGTPVVVCPRFDPVLFLESIQKYRITNILVAPPVLVFLNSAPIVDKYDLSSLKNLGSGAAPLPASVVYGLTERFTKKGYDVSITNGYGMTETSPASHVLKCSMSLKKVGSVGELFPNLEARLMDDNDKDVKEGERGEIWIRGAVVMKGYVNNRAATEGVMTPDGWFKTGDIAIRDPEGFYYIVDRKKELIKYKGFQVPPAELESILLGHPEIADAAVIGIEDTKQATELPRAYIVPRAGVPDLTTRQGQEKFAKKVQKWMETKVAKHKYLRGGVVIIAAVPKSAAGKILRRELRALAAKELAAETKSKL